MSAETKGHGIGRCGSGCVVLQFGHTMVHMRPADFRAFMHEANVYLGMLGQHDAAYRELGMVTRQ